MAAVFARDDVGGGVGPADRFFAGHASVAHP